MKMDTSQDIEDLLFLLGKHKVKYLIVGGLAFSFHAKPRYTKDIDLWVDPDPENIKSANIVLIEFGSPLLISLPIKKEEILQLGFAPNRIDILLDIPGVRFNTAWKKRIKSKYGNIQANWIDIDSLIKVKKSIDHPRHQEDVRVLLQVKEMKKK